MRLRIQPEGVHSITGSVLRGNVWPALFASSFLDSLCSLLQRIRSHGHAVAKMDIRTSRATITNTVSMNHFHAWAF